MSYYQPCLQPLEKGDVIAVAYGNYFHIGIFKRYGKVGNTQFWSVKRILENKEYYEKNNLPLKTVYVDYVNTDATDRVLKIEEPKILGVEKFEQIKEAIEFLKNHKQL